MRTNAAIVAIGLAAGMLLGLAPTMILLGFDGLSLLFLFVAAALLYFGVKGMR